MKILPIIIAAATAIPVIAAQKAAAKDSTIQATVLDRDGDPVKGAVVWVLDGNSTEKPQTRTMNMKGMDFDPGFLAVTVGDSVSFPNLDTTHHHVYSFSKTKKFDSRLYKDGPPKIVKFDKAGLVKTGCKIHDWMRGTILVTKSNRRVVTKENGKASLAVSGKGPIRLGIYHPRIRGKYKKHELSVPLKNGKGTASWTIKLKSVKNKKSRNRKIYY